MKKGRGGEEAGKEKAKKDEWDVEYTEEFETWLNGLTEGEQDEILANVNLLRLLGTTLGYPRSSKINGSKHGAMRELRIQYQGEPYRVLYAFDPRRVAMVLLGGNKAGDDRWYRTNVPIADKIFDRHLSKLGGKGKGKR